MEKSKEWLAARRAGVGGSDVDSVLNLEPYGCSRRLWYDKRDYPQDYPVLMNPNMQRGVYLEDIVRRIYQEQTGNKVVEAKPLKSKDHPFMVGHIDGIIFKSEIDNPNDSGVLEIKCPTRSNYFSMKRNGISEGYILQGQHYMYVADKPWMNYAIHCADMWELLVVPVQRDDELIEKIVESEERFWQMVENGPTPDALDLGDKRCRSCVYRKTCWGELWDRWFEVCKDKDEAEIPDLSKDKKYIAAVNDYIIADDAFKEADLLKQEAKARLIEIMGDRVAVRGAGMKIYYKPSIRHYWDLKLLEKDYPYLKPKYEKTSITKTFKPYRIGE